MNAHLPDTNRKKVVIVGGGFAGLKLARKLANSKFHVILLDKNNFHQFQPLLYQVATGGLEPSAIAFPLRKVFHTSDVTLRVAYVKSVDIKNSFVETSIGRISYDHLVIATGTSTNFWGNESVEKHAMPMKTVGEALDIRNMILCNYEFALNIEDETEKQKYMNLVVVGGGPTGVEVSGAIAEMRRHVLPKDYPELDFKKMRICLVESSPRVLNGMSEEASEKATKYLLKLGVEVKTGVGVKEFDGDRVMLADGTSIPAKMVVWAAGVLGNKIEGFPVETVTKSGRLIVDRFNQVQGCENIYAIGDIAFMTEPDYPKGHPQVAQVAIQQAGLLAKNILRKAGNEKMAEFHYKDRGTMATIGRNLAVADLPNIKFYGFFAWVLWMLVHLMSLVGFKNRLLTLINWAWYYFTYDQALRLIIRHKK